MNTLQPTPVACWSAPDLPDVPAPEEALAIVARIGFESGMESVWSLLCGTLKRYGFDRVNYSFVPALHDAERATMSTRVALSTHPARTREVYRSARFDRSPMRVWAMRNAGAISWSEQPRLMREYGMEADGPALNAFLKELGFHAGYTIGFPVTARSGKGALGVTARRGLDQADVDAIWTLHGTAIEALATAAHGRLALMPLPVLHDQLNARQREILGWIADGKTVADVALLTRLSVSAVEKNLARARDCLGAETTPQAVAKLALLNQLVMPVAAPDLSAEPSRRAR